MIALRSQAYYAPGLPKYLRIVSPQGICTSEGYKGTFIAHCHDQQDGYAELNLKEDKPGWQNAEPVKRVYVNYDPNNNLPDHEANLPNQRENEAKALTNAVCVSLTRLIRKSLLHRNSYSYGTLDWDILGSNKCNG